MPRRSARDSSEDPRNSSEDPRNPSEDPRNPSEHRRIPSKEPRNPSKTPTESALACEFTAPLLVENRDISGSSVGSLGSSLGL